MQERVPGCAGMPGGWKWQPARPSPRIQVAGHRRTPWRFQCRRKEGLSLGAGKPRLQRPRSDQRFPPSGVKHVPSYGWPRFRRWGWTSKVDMISTTPTLFSQRAEPSPLWSETSPKRCVRHRTTEISRVLCDKVKRGCGLPVPLGQRNGAPQRGDAGGGSSFFAAGAARARAMVDRGPTPFAPLAESSLSSQ